MMISKEMKKPKNLIPAAVAGVIVTSLAAINVYAAEEASAPPAEASMDSDAVQSEAQEQNQEDTRETTALSSSDLQTHVNDNNEVSLPSVSQTTEGEVTHVTGEVEAKNPVEISEEQKQEDEKKVKEELDNAFNPAENPDSGNSSSDNSEQTAPGSTDSDQNNIGSTDSGQNNPSSTDSEQNNSGSTDSEQNSSGSTDSEQTTPGSTDSDQDSSGSADSGQNNSGSTDFDQNNTGSGDSGQNSTGSDDSGQNNSGFTMEDWDLGKVGETGSQFGNFTVISNETAKTGENENTSVQEIKLGMTLDRGDNASSPLTKEEIEILTGQTLTANDDGSFFYTSNGVTYTYTITNNSTQHTECDVVVSITRTTIADNTDQVSDKREDSWQPQQPGENPEGVSAAEILNGIDRGNNTFNGKQADISYYTDGKNAGEISQIIVYETADKGGASTTYVFEYGDVAADVENLNPDNSNDQQTILDLLGEDFKLVDGKFYKTVDNADYLMTDVEIQIALKNRSVTMEVKIKSEDQTQHPDGDESAIREKLEKDATANALGKALKDAAEIIEISACGYDKNGYFVKVGDVIYRFTPKEDGTYSVTVPGKNGEKDVEKTYTFSVIKTMVDAEKGKLDESITAELKESGQNLAHGSTTEIKTAVIVEGKVILWTSTENGGSIISDEGTVIVEKGKQFGNFEGEIVESLTYKKDANGKDTQQIDTVVTKNGDVTKTYTFNYENADPTELGFSDTGSVTFNELKKTTWTVEINTKQKDTDTKGETIGIAGNKTKTAITKNANGTLTYTDENGHSVVCEKKPGEDVYTGQYDVHGNTWTYKITETEESVLEDNQKTLLLSELKKSGYQDLTIDAISINGTKAIFQYGGKEYTVEFTAPTKYSYSITIEEPRTISSVGSEEAFISMMRELLDELKESGKKLISNINQNLGELNSGSSDDDIKKWITNTAINFNAMTVDDLTALLREMKTQTEALRNGKNDKKPIPDGKVSHLDLGCATKIAVNGELQDCVIVGVPDMWYSDDIESLVTADGNPADGAIKNELQSVIRTDRVNMDENKNPIIHYEFEHETGTPKSYKFYYVKGLVGYNLVKNEEGGTSFRTYEDALNALKEKLDGMSETDRAKYDSNNLDKHIVPVYREKAYNSGNPENLVFDNGNYVDGYRVYLDDAKLVVYGYMDSVSNACGNWKQGGFDLKLGNLAIMNNGDAAGTGDGIKSWTANCLIQSEDQGWANVLKLLNIITGGESGSKVIGKQKVTSSATGTATGSYSEYTLWKISDGIGNGASQTWHEGSAGYNLQRTALGIDEQEWLIRNVDASYTTSQYTPPATPPTTPTTPATPTTPPSETITETRYPAIYTERGGRSSLASIPDAAVPLASISDEAVPLADIFDEAVPLTSISEEEVPLSYISDETVPLASFPRTGDRFTFELITALMSGLGAFWLGLSKKRL